MRVVLLALMLSSLALAGCTDEPAVGEAVVPEDAPEPLATGFIRGVVVDPAIRPIGSAVVTVLQDGSEAAILTTDADGNFGVGGLAPGNTTVNVTAPGYLPTDVDTVVVAGEQTPDLVQVTLDPHVGEQPLILPIYLKGTVACAHTGANWCTIVNIYSGTQLAEDQSGAQFYDDVMAPQEQATYAVTEVVWEPNNLAAESMTLRLSAGNWEYWSTFTVAEFYHSEAGSRYIRHVIDDVVRDDDPDGLGDLTRNGVGTETGLGIELFPGNGIADPGVMVQQPFKLFMTVFYGCEPAEGWSTLNGDPLECA